MEVTAGEPVREEYLKGRLDRFGVFALVRGQVSQRSIYRLIAHRPCQSLQVAETPDIGT
jgi:hypothetical protein